MLPLRGELHAVLLPHQRASRSTRPVRRLRCSRHTLAFPAAYAPTTTGITGTILARLVNAGLRMHVPSIVNPLTTGFNGSGAATATVSGFTLIAEDGNPVPGVQVAGATAAPAAPRVQTDVFMAAGKVFDVMFNAPAAGSTDAGPAHLRPRVGPVGQFFHARCRNDRLYRRQWRRTPGCGRHGCVCTRGGPRGYLQRPWLRGSPSACRMFPKA